MPPANIIEEAQRRRLFFGKTFFCHFKISQKLIKVLAGLFYLSHHMGGHSFEVYACNRYISKEIANSGGILPKSICMLYGKGVTPYKYSVTHRTVNAQNFPNFGNHCVHKYGSMYLKLFDLFKLLLH